VQASPAYLPAWSSNVRSFGQCPSGGTTASRDTYGLGEPDATRGECRTAPCKSLFGLAGIKLCCFQHENPLDFLGDKLFSLADARCGLKDFVCVIHGQSTQNRPACSVRELFIAKIDHEIVKAARTTLTQMRAHGRNQVMDENRSRDYYGNRPVFGIHTG
jgi:hypothetical protein